MRRTLLALLFLLFAPCSNAVVLEDLISSNILQKSLQNKNVCFYTGSFDPLHKGHENVVTSSLQKNTCDYVLLYPSWMDDYKQMTNIDIRLEMLFAVFKDDARVIVTKLPPYALQQALTKNHSANQDAQAPRKPMYEIRFIGMVGSDNALKRWTSPDPSFVYMSGIKIPDQYKFHTLGGLMALPVERFIVAMRQGDNALDIPKSISDKPVTIIYTQNNSNTSATMIKDALAHSEPITSFVSKSIADIIQTHSLYRHK